MTSSKPIEPAIPSPLAAISLKLVGAITIISSLIDSAILLFPPNFGNRGWQVATVTGLVDRGIVPLIGIVLIFTGYWIDSSIGKPLRRSNLALDPRFWTCLLSCLLGLTFLLTAVFHPNNISFQTNEALEQIENSANRDITELETSINEGLSQRKAVIDRLLQNEEELQAAIAGGGVDEAQIAQIERFRDNPQEIDSFLSSQATEVAEQEKIRIGEQKQQLISQLGVESFKGKVGVTLNSLLLALSYTFIGWSGLRRLLAMVS